MPLCAVASAGREAMAFPVLAPRVGLADEQDFAPAGISRHQHQNRLRLIDARQIQEVALLAVLVIDVA